jgi:hypothetical protein
MSIGKGNEFKAVGKSFSYVGEEFKAVGKSFSYTGKTYTNCSPSGAQKTALTNDTNMQNTLKAAYGTVFGLDSAMYKSLNSKLDAIAANPNGLDPATEARINAGTLARSAASEQAAQAAVNAKGATSSADPGVESGVTQQVRGQVISGLETAKNNELNTNAVQDAELGIQERDKALGEEANLGNVFNSSEGFAKDDLTALGEESSQANANEAASSSWMGLVGGIADAAAGGIGAGVGKKIAGCWVAAEFYGWHTPEWFSVRNWLRDTVVMRPFWLFYLQVGERWASLVRKNTAVRLLTKKLFNFFLKQSTK